MGTTATPQFMVVMDFTLIGAKVNAGLIKTDSGERIFLRPDKVAPNPGVDLDTLVKEINRLFGDDNANKIDKTKITNELAPLGKTGKLDPMAVKFVLTAAYLDMFVPKDNNGKRTVEYAFRLDVDATGLIADNIALIDIDKLAIAVWNTDDSVILKQLNIPELK